MCVCMCVCMCDSMKKRERPRKEGVGVIVFDHKLRIVYFVFPFAGELKYHKQKLE